MIITEEDIALAHFGVKGMKWGVRKDSPDGVSSRTNREAKKDAEEFARAKMFYGEGAGTRRKLIKATVEGKAKKDPTYKKAFDHHLDNQNLSDHAAKARGERKRKNAKNSAGKTARGIKNVVTGNSQRASISAIAVATGATYAHQKGYDRVALDKLKNAVSKNSVRAGKEMLRDLGIY